jgi:hypothetical protein
LSCYEVTRGTQPGGRSPLVQPLGRRAAPAARLAQPPERVVRQRQTRAAAHAREPILGVVAVAARFVRDLLEILDDRYDRASTLITSQLPIDQWHSYLGDRTVSDATLDRLVHNSYRVALKGESMRRHKSLPQAAAPTPSRIKGH